MNSIFKSISIKVAILKDYPLIQNMARFYVYDLSRDCGHASKDWALPKDGLYESFDFKDYFENASKKAYLVTVCDEIAGFVLLNQETKNKPNTWNMGEFFVIARFQGRGVASYVADKIWRMHPGKWEVSVIPDNRKALSFLKKSIEGFTAGVFRQSIKTVTHDKCQPERILFEFESKDRDGI